MPHLLPIPDTPWVAQLPIAARVWCVKERCQAMVCEPWTQRHMQAGATPYGVLQIRLLDHAAIIRSGMSADDRRIHRWYCDSAGRGFDGLPLFQPLVQPATERPTAAVLRSVAPTLDDLWQWCKLLSERVTFLEQSLLESQASHALSFRPGPRTSAAAVPPAGDSAAAAAAFGFDLLREREPLNQEQRHEAAVASDAGEIR